MKKNIRRRRADSSDEEKDGHGSGQEQIQKKTLAELREEMKQRKARGGIQAASTLDVASVDEAAGKGKKRTAAAEAAAEDEEEVERQKSIGEMMESNFTGMRYVKKDDTTPHEKLMEQYIKEKLAAQGLGSSKKAGAEEEEGNGAGAGSTKLSRQDKLRQITEELHTKAQPEGKKGGEGEGTVSEGGPIAYSTGIAEVALPIEFKLRNIEATERAQQALEREGAKGQREEIVGNMTNNYFHYRREHAIEMRAREGKPAGAFRRPDGEGPKGRDVMTDDLVYNRFHKRNRR